MNYDKKKKKNEYQRLHLLETTAGMLTYVQHGEKVYYADSKMLFCWPRVPESLNHPEKVSP